MLRNTPPGEDPLKNTRAVPVSVQAVAMPPGEDGVANSRAAPELENMAAQEAAAPQGVDNFEEEPQGINFLQLVREAESQALLYVEQANRRAWSDSLRAFHNEHYIGSKYTKPEWRARSKLFVPKTRAAVRKDNAAVAASLFNSIDAINCAPGDEGDAQQRAAADLMTEVINYRTDRTSGKASFPWFLVSMGARQDAVLTGVCGSKQYWKQEFRKAGSERVAAQDETGVFVEKDRDVFTLEVDRPDIALFPPENYIIDPAADWTNPAQSAAFFIIKWPMTLEEIKRKQENPISPWLPVEEAALKNAVEAATYDMAAVRRAREMGLDRLDETQTGTTFNVIWVYEVFMRIDGEDWTFYSIGSKDYLTDPAPVREIYPEQAGERPIALGYGSLESHRIFPMAPVESWQPLQLEVNDLRNLRLDATKQNVMPISKVKRGRQIDLDQVKRRSSGSSIFVTDPTDVTWEPPPAIPPTVVEMSRELDVEFDDLAAVQNFGNVQQNNALGKTLGGLKLAAGAANAVQEFDIRVWIETWATPALAQIVRLEQYYENDETVLGICGNRAQLWQKHGIDLITNELLEQEITIRVSVGLGAGDPQQRLAKFESAAQIVAPILQQSPKFQSGQITINEEAVIEEVFGAAGYKDGGKRFFTDNGQPRANPMQDLQTEALKAKIAKDQRTGKAAMFTGIASLAKVALGKRELEADVVDMLLGHQREAKSLGFDHGHARNQMHLSALDHGHRHGMAINEHRRQLASDARAHAQQQYENEANAQANAQEPDGEGAGSEGAVVPGGQPSSASPQGSPPASSPPSGAEGGQPGQGEQGGQLQQYAPQQPDMQQILLGLLQSGQLEFVRDPHTGKISGARLVPAQGQGAPRPPTVV